MHPRTIATLGKLEKADWFSRVGVSDTTNAIVLSSWKAAVKHCSANAWRNLCLEAANQYRERLREKDREALRRWNSVVDLVKPASVALVQFKIEGVVKEYDLPRAFENAVSWDILHLCMESEFADIYPPGFYASQAYWYIQGHFPCGWKGKFPEGMLIIY